MYMYISISIYLYIDIDIDIYIERERLPSHLRRRCAQPHTAVHWLYSYKGTSSDAKTLFCSGIST